MATILYCKFVFSFVQRWSSYFQDAAKIIAYISWIILGFVLPIVAGLVSAERMAVADIKYYVLFVFIVISLAAGVTAISCKKRLKEESESADQP